jgi:hypothetical protein
MITDAPSLGQVPPVQAAVQQVELETAIHDLVIRRGNVDAELRIGHRHLRPCLFDRRELSPADQVVVVGEGELHGERLLERDQVRPCFVGRLRNALNSQEADEISVGLGDAPAAPRGFRGYVCQKLK